MNMKNFQGKWKNRCFSDKLIITIGCICSIIYVALLFSYYNSPWYAFDFAMYTAFPLEECNYAAKDGFSSLFLFIMGLARMYPRAIHLGALICIAVCMWSMVLTYSVICEKRTVLSDLAAIGIVYGTSVWYYFYGKLVYDFPLSAGNIAIVLLLLSLIWKKEKCVSAWCFFCVTIGLLLSWKMYNIFFITGLFLLVLTSKQGRRVLQTYLLPVSNLFISICIAILGYVFGNFNLLIRPKETIEGIMAYPAECDTWHFLFINRNASWDNVNIMAFNWSSMLVGVVVTVLVICPIISKRWGQFAVSVFMCLCFGYFVRYHSPGYPWHGFMFALFVVMFALFNITSWNKVSKIVCAMGIMIQLVTCFGYYIPIQTRWQNVTIECIDEIQEDSEFLADYVKKVGEELSGTYRIEIPIYRYRHTQPDNRELQKISFNHPYIVPSNEQYVDVLGTIMMQDEWSVVKNDERYLGTSDADNTLFIVPKVLEEYPEVFDVMKYSHMDTKKIYNIQDYIIYVY